VERKLAGVRFRGGSRAAVFSLMIIGLLSPFPVFGKAGFSDMVLVPEGEFILGTEEVDTDQEALSLGLPHSWYVDEHPRSKVFLASFYIDRYEVTNKQYLKFIKAADHHPPTDWVKNSYPPGKGEFPVVFVSWFDAGHYCRWAGKRLPTEMEWEKAARGPEGLKYPWGNAFDPDLANVAGGPATSGKAGAVGRYEGGKSPYGVYDLIGNVWEWTDSLYQPYPGNQTSRDMFGKNLRVNRGLSFMGIGHFPPDLHRKIISIVGRASFRSYDSPTAKLPDVGFRCASSRKEAPD
jgi:formylglycine-generating enzyme required for sulfatase activity